MNQYYVQSAYTTYIHFKMHLPDTETEARDWASAGPGTARGPCY